MTIRKKIFLKVFQLFAEGSLGNINIYSLFQTNTKKETFRVPGKHIFGNI